MSRTDIGRRDQFLPIKLKSDMEKLRAELEVSKAEIAGLKKELKISHEEVLSLYTALNKVPEEFRPEKTDKPDKPYAKPPAYKAAVRQLQREKTRKLNLEKFASSMGISLSNNESNGGQDG